MRKPKYDFLLGCTKKFEMLKCEIYFKIMTGETGSVLNMFRKKKHLELYFSLENSKPEFIWPCAGRYIIAWLF